MFNKYSRDQDSMAPNTQDRSTESRSEDVSESHSRNHSESLSESLSESRVTSLSGRVLRSNSKRKSSSGVSSKPPGKQRKQQQSAQEAQKESEREEEEEDVVEESRQCSQTTQLSEREVLVRIERRAEELGLTSCKLVTAEISHFIRVPKLLDEVGKLFVAEEKCKNEHREEKSKRAK